MKKDTYYYNNTIIINYQVRSSIVFKILFTNPLSLKSKDYFFLNDKRWLYHYKVANTSKAMFHAFLLVFKLQVTMYVFCIFGNILMGNHTIVIIMTCR